MSKRILIAEDDPGDLELTIHALAEHDLADAVHTVRDGADALDFLYGRGAYAANPPPVPAAVILDLKMPRKNGLDVIRQMKSDGDLKRIPIIVLTSSREVEDLHTCYELGVNAYVVKPLKF